ncbi:MAG TPA: DUF3617 family protein [Sphingomicrobium sp.]|nr:DUF3617 family protein [Sphingomicrobium sp.]
MTRIFGAAAGVAVAALLGGAAPLSIFSQAKPGLWEIARSGSEPARLCLANLETLPQIEHRKAGCPRTVIRDSQSEALVHYTCRGGDFGQTRMTLLTPRSFRVQTQGISAGEPFNYTFQARRVGTCPTH